VAGAGVALTIKLDAVPPSNASIFICDYKERGRTNAGRSKAAGQLAKSRGGALGVTSLREIVVGVRSIEEASREWRRLIDSPDQESKAVFAFGAGPRIRLEPAEVEGIQGIVIGVHSIARAREFLTQRHMLGEASEGRVGIAPAAVGGLRITLVEE
jgi:hypothetical protein